MPLPDILLRAEVADKAGNPPRSVQRADVPVGHAGGGQPVVQHLPELVVREALDQQLLGLGLHLHKGLRCLLLGKQAEHDGDLLFLQAVEETGHVRGVHGDEDVPQSGILLLFQHLEEGFFYDFKAFCHSFTSNI